MGQMSIENAAECIRSTVSMLARSQGFYGRLYESIEEAGGWEDVARSALNAGINPADDVSVVLFFEA